jgi:hypothetical protein
MALPNSLQFIRVGMVWSGPSTDDLVKSNSGKLLLMNVTVDGKSEYEGVFNIVLDAK